MTNKKVKWYNENPSRDNDGEFIKIKKLKKVLTSEDGHDNISELRLSKDKTVCSYEL